MSQNNKEAGNHELHEEQKDQQKTDPAIIFNDIMENGIKKKDKARASIYRVPDELRAQNENAYTPYVVSIGPLHSNDPHLDQGIKKHRVGVFLQEIYEKSTEQETGVNKFKTGVIEKCLSEMQTLSKDAKNSYGEEVDNQLTPEMMFIDGCFILSLLHCFHDRKKKENSKDDKYPPVAPTNQKHVDPIFGSYAMQTRIKHDLLLLENQLPFKVLKTLYTLTLAKILPDNPPCSLTHFVRLYFDDVMGVSNHEEKYCSSGMIVKFCCHPSITEVNFHHLLHVVHNRYLPPEDCPGESKFAVVNMCSATDLDFAAVKMRSATDLDFAGVKMRSATDLDFAGVKFKVAPKEEKEVPLLKIKFGSHDTPGISETTSRSFCGGKKLLSWWKEAPWKDAPFEIPAINVTDATELFLRNLIAFEYCCPEVPNHFTWYANFMDRLINSEDDVKVLERDGVLYNNLGDREAVAKMFNNLCKEIYLGKLYFVDECNRVVDHSKKGYRKFMAHFRRKWSDAPWTFIAFLIAAIAFSMSIIQFVQSFLG